MLRFAGSGRSDVGLVREDNEDSGFVGPTCLIVADGVGGAAAGEIASATTAYVVSALVLSRAGQDPAAVLGEAVVRSHRQLVAGMADHPDREGMSTTLTAIATDGDGAALAHVGDSRAYLLRDGVLQQLTRDHSWVQAMVDQGRLSPEAAVDHPYRNVILHTVNADETPRGDLRRLDLRVGDRLLLASDGLTDLVRDDEIHAVLTRSPDDLRASGALVAAALREGGRDNVTCVVATVVDGPPVTGDGELLGAVRRPELVVDPTSVRADASA